MLNCICSSVASINCISFKVDIICYLSKHELVNWTVYYDILLLFTVYQLGLVSSQIYDFHNRLKRSCHVFIYSLIELSIKHGLLDNVQLSDE